VIEVLSVHNFRVLRNVAVKLRPLTVIVGPNASGKSTLLRALDALRPAIQTGMRLEAPEQLAESMSRSPVGSFVGLEYAGRVLDAPFHFSCQIFESLIDFSGTWKQKKLSRFELQELLDSIRPAVYLNLNAGKIALPSVMGGVSHFLASDGEGLAWYLSGLYLEYPVQFREIVSRLKEIIPVVQDLRIHRALLDTGQVGFELLFDTHAADNVPAHSVSEGTLLTLGILAALHLPKRPQLVLIDNLDQGLHPRALKDLVEQLRRIQEQDSELQIVATSHSPYLLDAVRPEEVLLTSLDESGYTAVKPLTDHPEYDRWKDLMAPGEFWSTVGEGWVAQAAKP